MEGKEYFYLSGDTKVGPFTLEALKSAPITSSTLVWNNTLPDWVEASSLPELADFFTAKSAPTPPSPTVSNSFNTGNMGGNTFNNPNMAPPMPDNYLVWGILSTLFCCLPLGIVSIISSTKVGSAYAAGDYAGAQKASEDAKKWAMWSAIGGVVFWVLYIIFIVIVGVSAGLSGY